MASRRNLSKSQIERDIAASPIRSCSPAGEGKEGVEELRQSSPPSTPTPAELLQQVLTAFSSMQLQMAQLGQNADAQAGQLKQLREKMSNTKSSEERTPLIDTPREEKNQGDDPFRSRLQELSGTSAELPPRTTPASNDVRLRGGQERVDSRASTIKRVLRDGGELSAGEFEEIKELLVHGSQVNPDHTRSNYSYTQFEQSRPIPAMRGLFDRLQDLGVAPIANGADAVVSTLLRELREKGKKENSKRVESCTTFAKFWSKMKELQALAPQVLESDPEAYWAIDAHLKCVLELFAEKDWATASRYHASVMTKWMTGEVNMCDLSQSLEARRGHFGSAMHQRSYMEAITHKSTSGTGGAPKGGTGSKEKVQSSDTYCDYHLMYYPLAANHKSGNCFQKKKNAPARPLPP